MKLCDALAYRCDCWQCMPQCEALSALKDEIERLKIKTERQYLLIRNYELSEALDRIFTPRECDAAHMVCFTAPGHQQLANRAPARCVQTLHCRWRSG